MDKQEINRRISELKCPLATAKMGGLNGQWFSINNEWVSELGYDRTPPLSAFRPRDWTGDETANAELLDEMFESNSEITFSHWDERSYVKKETPISVFVNVVRDSERVEYRGDAKDRKTAVCLAWLKWKQECGYFAEKDQAL